jgi:cobyrinic acid a,c-diamide synthase
MGTKRAALGYRQIELVADTILGIRGEQFRGHEFHYSTISDMPLSVDRSYLVSRPGEQGSLEGYSINNCLASYVHLHFGSLPHGARFLVEACRSGGGLMGRIRENLPLHLLGGHRGFSH